MKWLAIFWEQQPDLLNKIWHFGADEGGVVAALRAHIRAFGFREVAFLTWDTGSGLPFQLPSLLATTPRRKLWHDWRTRMRQHVWRVLCDRRPIFSGVADVDRKRTLKIMPSLGPREQGILRVVLMDGLLTNARLHRDPELRVCDECQEEEDPYHVMWRCPKWRHLRYLPEDAMGHFPSATRVCGLICVDQPPLAETLQRQLLAVAAEYIRSRPVPLRRPRPMPLPDQEALPRPEPRVPLLRVRKKMNISLVPSVPPRPFAGTWHGQGHVCRCVRSRHGWKAQCVHCGKTRAWNRRHLLPECQHVKKGARIAPPEGFFKDETVNPVRITCASCHVSSLWCSKSRFVRHHVCKRDQDGDVVPALPPHEMKARLTLLGFAAHVPLAVDGMWECQICAKRLKRKQSLQQEWCSFPPWASAYKYA